MTRCVRANFARLKLGTAVLAALAVVTPAAAQNMTITNARLMDGTGAAERGNVTITVRDGRIASVSENSAAAGANVIDAGGNYVTPGLVSAFSDLGIVEVGAVRQTNEIDADDSPYSAALDIAPAVNPRSTRMAINRIEGVTKAAAVPMAGRDLFGGMAAIVSLSADGETIVRPRAMQYISMGERGSRLAGGSRAATFARLKDAFRDAELYARNPGGYGAGNSRDALLTRADAAALVPVIQGEMPAMIDVHRASDIEQVLDLKQSYPRLRLILSGVAEGWMVADRLARENIPVIAVPMYNLPGSFESLGSTQSNVGRMVAAGVKVAIADPGQPRLMTQQAGQTVAQARIPGAAGLTRDQALAAITSVPASILGINAGSIAPGKDADIVIWDGDPIEISSAPTAVYIGGVAQPMDSRQTKLRDRYNPANADTGLPKQYSR